MKRNSPRRPGLPFSPVAAHQALPWLTGLLLLGCGAFLRAPALHAPLTLPLLDPGRAYQANPAEKDTAYAADDTAFRFTALEILPRPSPVPGAWMADLVFKDKSGALLRIPSFNLMTLIPKLDTQGPAQHAEFLMDEFERVGVTLDRDDGQFEITLPDGAGPKARDAAQRAWRVGIWNNCLDPTKWEMILFSRYYLGRDSAYADPHFRSRHRTLAHAWFYMDKTLYADLVRRKNPNLAIDVFQPYDSLHAKAALITLAADSLGRVARELATEMQEVGHKSDRKLTEINSEQWYKKRYKIIMNRQHFYTYREILERPVWLAPFQDRGFYEPKDTVRFDYGWMKKLDRIRLGAVAAPGPLRYVRLDVEGPETPYRIVIGNLDLAQLNEHKLFEMSFGIDPMPRNGRHWVDFDPCLYRLEGVPETRKPFMYMVDAKTGAWANNQLLGLDKAYIGWESPERKVLWVYFVTYERVISVWMGRVKITDPALAADRIRNAVHAPESPANYPPPDFPALRRHREAGNARVSRYADLPEVVTLDFEGLRHEDDRLAPHGFHWQEKGFRLTSAAFLGGEPFRSVGTAGFRYSGSTALLNGNRSGINVLRKQDETIAESLDEHRGYFDLLSIDLAEFASDPDAELAFVGVKWDSNTVARTVRLDGKPGSQTYVFEDFTDLIAVRWMAGGAQFDNVRLRYPSRHGRKARKVLLSGAP